MIISLLKSISDKYFRWEFTKCFHRIRKLRYTGNFKWVYRIYFQLKLNIRSKRNKSLPQRYPELLSVPNRLGECWSRGFISDCS